jgi:hypothetical protein
MDKTSIRAYIQTKFKIGQNVTLQVKSQDTGKVIDSFKVKVVGYYDHFVLTDKNNHKECYGYQDFYNMAVKG